MKIKLPSGNCSSRFNCSIAKGLRRKGIIAYVGDRQWYGLFLGIIPVSGPISEIDEAKNVLADKKVQCLLRINGSEPVDAVWLDKLPSYNIGLIKEMMKTKGQMNVVVRLGWRKHTRMYVDEKKGIVVRTKCPEIW